MKILRSEITLLLWLVVLVGSLVLGIRAGCQGRDEQREICRRAGGEPSFSFWRTAGIRCDFPRGAENGSATAPSRAP